MFTGEGSGGSSLISLILAIIVIAGMWKMFEKAGYPGWGAIIPIYNFYVLIKMAGYPGIYLLLMLIPLVNFVFLIFVYIKINKAFGQEPVMVLGLIFLPFVFFPLLGFGDAKYHKV